MKATNTNETTPLLATQPVEDPDVAKPKAITPLPKLQLGMVTCMRLVEPIAYTQIFPYINKFLDGLHVTDNPQRIGFYSGLVESTYAVFQLVSIYHFARLSDRIGRRPVILSGLIGVACSTFLFGLSGSLPFMLMCRALAGLSSGNAAVMQSVVSEITDSSNFPQAAPLFGLSWPLGTIIGPFLGGSLATPAEKYSWLDTSFFRKYPYFLPGGVSGVLTLTAVAVGFFILRESLPRKVQAQTNRERSPSPTLDSDTDSQAETETRTEADTEPMGVRALMSHNAIFAITCSNFGLSFMSMGFEVIFVLYSYTSVLNGGLGFPPKQIGYALSVSGITNVALQFFGMPFLLARFDKAKMFNVCFWMYPLIFPIMALLNAVARAGRDEATGTLSAQATAGIWAGICVVLLMSRSALLAFPISMILIKDHCPSVNSVGMSYGIASFMQCMARAVSPTVMSSIYAFSNEHSILGGFGWVPAMVLISLLAVYQSASVLRATR